MKITSNLLLMCLIGLVTSHVRAQEDAPANDAELLSTAARRSVAVASILDSPRDTPEKQLFAVLTLVDLGESKVAAVEWKSLAEANIDDAVAASLAEKFGTARLMKLARLERPAGDQTPATFVGAEAFVSRLIEAAAKKARNPERLTKLITDLNNPDPAIRKAARVDLAATGVDGAKACLEALAKATDETVRANLMLAISNLKAAAEPLIIAAVVDGQGHFQRDVVELCGYLKINDAVPFLATIVAGGAADADVMATARATLKKIGLTVPNGAEARILLARDIKRIEAGAIDRPFADSTPLLWWSWNDSAGTFKSTAYDLPTTEILAAERLAKLLTTCGDPTPQQRELAFIYHLESLPILQIQGADLSEDSYSTANISSTLATALKRNRLHAAATCLAILAKRNDPSILISNDGQPSPLASALAHGNRSLRFAALEAIMNLSPQRSFAGASLVPKVLWEFAAGAGPRQAVAASSVILRADDWAAQLRERGHAATPANSGRTALKVALNSPRLELVLIDSDIDLPPLREIVYQLRSHEISARVPVAVLCSLPNLEYARRVAATDSKLFAVARPHNEQAMQDIVDRLMQLRDEPANDQVSTERAVQAIQWLGELLNQGHPYDELHRNVDILSQTVHIPGLVEPSLQSLAVAGTAGSQLTLINFASQQVHPIEARQLAAEAFAASADRFGKLLRISEIQRQYERYNASKTADADTQQVLGKILDVLEGREAEATTATPELNP